MSDRSPSSTTKPEILASLGYVVGALLALTLSYWTSATLPLTRGIARPLGLAVVLAGGALYTWAIAYLRKSFFGNVAPAGKRLVTAGPYRWVRHPNYLGAVIVMLGLALALRSLWGIVGTLALALPAAIYRARLEERALAQEFGDSWKAYARRTSFFLPGPW